MQTGEIATLKIRNLARKRRWSRRRERRKERGGEGERYLDGRGGGREGEGKEEVGKEEEDNEEEGKETVRLILAKAAADCSNHQTTLNMKKGCLDYVIQSLWADVSLP